MNDDKEKSVIDKFKDTISEAVGNMASAMTVAPEEKRKKVAATTNEQVYIPEATDAAAMPAPLFAAPARKRKTSASAKPASRAKKAAKKTRSSAERKAAAKKRPAKKVAKKRKKSKRRG
jgi:hypothetical protein